MNLYKQMNPMIYSTHPFTQIYFIIIIIRKEAMEMAWSLKCL